MLSACPQPAYSRPPDGNDPLGMNGIVLDFFAQITDVDSDRPRILQTLHPPDEVKQRIDRDHLIHVLCHVGEQAEFFLDRKIVLLPIWTDCA